MKTICSFSKCENSIHSKGLCKGHYQQQYHGKELTELGSRGRRKIWGNIKCDVESCDAMAVSSGLCARCYGRLRNIDISRDDLIKLPGTCEVCGSSERMHLDHDHITGKARGVLCHKCNIALGMIMENKTIATELIKYINKYC